MGLHPNSLWPGPPSVKRGWESRPPCTAVCLGPDTQWEPRESLGLERCNAAVMIIYLRVEALSTHLVSSLLGAQGPHSVGLAVRPRPPFPLLRKLTGMASGVRAGTPGGLAGQGQPGPCLQVLGWWAPDHLWGLAVHVTAGDRHLEAATMSRAHVLVLSPQLGPTRPDHHFRCVAEDAGLREGSDCPESLGCDFRGHAWVQFSPPAP